MYITPTVRHALALVDAGAAVVAADATDRPRPTGPPSPTWSAPCTRRAHWSWRTSPPSPRSRRRRAGADFVSTTLSGYAPGSPRQSGPDLDLVASLSAAVTVPVVAEGASPPRASRRGTGPRCPQRRRRYGDHRSHRPDRTLRRRPRRALARPRNGARPERRPGPGDTVQTTHPRSLVPPHQRHPVEGVPRRLDRLPPRRLRLRPDHPRPHRDQ
ncbi:hypothetical protein NKH77_55340 [Streptomyces sp. M19]